MDAAQVEEQQQTVDLRHYLEVLRRRWWVIALCGVVFGLLGFLVSAQQTSRYAATANVRILDPNTEAVFDGANVRTDNQREVQTQQQVITSGPVRATADKALGARAGDITDVSVSNVPDTDILAIRAVARSPEAARDAANAIADAYVSFRKDELVNTFTARARELRTKATELNQEIERLTALIPFEPGKADLYRAQRAALINQVEEFERRANEEEVEASARGGNAQLLQSAELPSAPFDPKPVRTGLLAGLVGLLLGLVAVLVLDRLDDKVSLDNVEQLAGAPVLGEVRLHDARRLRRHHLPPSPRQLFPRDSDEAERFRALRTSLRFSSMGQKKQRLIITSPSGSEGKSTITANLAQTLTESNLRVVAISADLRRPTLARFFDIDETGPGLTSVLLGDHTVSEVAKRVPTDHGALYVVPAGTLPSNPAELLESEQMKTTLDWLVEAGADYILIDCPPVLPVTDPAALSQHADGVLMVCVPGQTRREDLREACGRMRRIGADIIGLVVNGVPAPPRYGQSYGGYGVVHPPGSSNGTATAIDGDLPSRSASASDATPARP